MVLTGATMEQNPEPDCRNLVRDRHELLTDGRGSRFASIIKLWCQVSLYDSFECDS